MGIRAGKLSSPDFLDKRGLDTSGVKQLHTDNNIYERYHKNGKDACTVERLSPSLTIAQKPSCKFLQLLNCIAEI